MGSIESFTKRLSLFNKLRGECTVEERNNYAHWFRDNYNFTASLEDIIFKLLPNSELDMAISEAEIFIASKNMPTKEDLDAI